MLRKKQRAAVAATAQTIEHQSKSYRNDLLTSSRNLQQDIGELLFCLEFPVGNELRQLGWMLFERLLRRHMGLVVLPKSVSEPLESTNTRQGVFG